MKLHLPILLLTAVVGAGSYAFAVTGTIQESSLIHTYDADNNPGGKSVTGVHHSMGGENVNNITTNVGDGAKIESLTGGITLAPIDYAGHKNLTEDTMDGGVTINVTGGTITQTIYGGNTLSQNLPNNELNDSVNGTADEKHEESAAILGDKINVGNIQINISGGTVGTQDSDDEAIMGGGGRRCGTESGKGIEVNISGSAIINNKVYAGTNGGSTGYTNLNILGGTINADVYAAGRKSYGIVEGNTKVALSGGVINGNVYAAGNQDTVEGNAEVVLTGNGTQVSGTIYGSGTNGAIVKGSSILQVGDANSAYTGDSIKVADFNTINVNNGSVKISSFATAEKGTTFNVADGASLELSLTDVVVTGHNTGLTFAGDGDITLDIKNLSYTVVLTKDVLALGGEQTFTLVEGAGDLLDNMANPNIKVNFVLEDGTAFDASYSLVVQAQEDMNLDGPITIGPDGSFIIPTSDKVAVLVTATIPEPTTATLSLLALAALATRRRRK